MKNCCVVDITYWGARMVLNWLDGLLNRGEGSGPSGVLLCFSSSEEFKLEGLNLKNKSSFRVLVALNCQAYSFVPRIVGNGSSGGQKGRSMYV